MTDPTSKDAAKQEGSIVLECEHFNGKWLSRLLAKAELADRMVEDLRVIDLESRTWELLKSDHLKKINGISAKLVADYRKIMDAVNKEENSK